MARPARASVVGAAEERSRVVSATSHVCSVLRRESWVCANVGGESLAGGLSGGDLAKVDQVAWRDGAGDGKGGGAESVALQIADCIERG